MKCEASVRPVKGNNKNHDQRVVQNGDVDFEKTFTEIMANEQVKRSRGEYSVLSGPEFDFLDKVGAAPDNKKVNDKDAVTMNNIQPPSLDITGPCTKCAIYYMQLYQSRLKTTEMAHHIQKLEERDAERSQTCDNISTRLQLVEPLLKVVQDENTELKKEKELQFQQISSLTKQLAKLGEQKIIGTCRDCRKRKSLELDQSPSKKEKLDISFENGTAIKARRGKKRTKGMDESESNLTSSSSESSFLVNNGGSTDSLQYYRAANLTLRDQNEDLKNKLNALADFYHIRTGEKPFIPDKYKSIWVAMGNVCDVCGKLENLGLSTEKDKSDVAVKNKMPNRNKNGKKRNKEMNEDEMKILEHVMTPATSENLSSFHNSDMSLSPSILSPQDEVLEPEVNGFASQCDYSAIVGENSELDMKKCWEILESYKYKYPILLSPCPSFTLEHFEEMLLPSTSHSPELSNTSVQIDNSEPVNQDVKIAQSHSFTTKVSESKSFVQLSDPTITKVFSKLETAATVSCTELLTPPPKPCESSDKDIVKLKPNQNDERQKHADICNSRKPERNKLENKIQSPIVLKQKKASNNKTNNSHGIFAYMESLSQLQQDNFDAYDSHNTHNKANVVVNGDSKIKPHNDEKTSVTGKLKDSLHSIPFDIVSENSRIKNEAELNNSTSFDTSLIEHSEFDHHKNPVIERGQSSTVSHKLEQQLVNDISEENKNRVIKLEQPPIVDQELGPQEFISGDMTEANKNQVIKREQLSIVYQELVPQGTVNGDISEANKNHYKHQVIKREQPSIVDQELVSQETTNSHISEGNKNQVIKREQPSIVDQELIPQGNVSNDISETNEDSKITSTVNDIMDLLTHEVESNLFVKKNPRIQQLVTRCLSNGTENFAKSFNESKNLQIKVPTENTDLEKEITTTEHNRENNAAVVTFTKKENMLLSLNLLPVNCIVNGKVQIDNFKKNDDQSLNESSLTSSFCSDVQDCLDIPTNNTKKQGMSALSSANSNPSAKSSNSKSKKAGKKPGWKKVKHIAKKLTPHDTKPLPKSHVILEALKGIEYLKFDKTKLGMTNSCRQLQNVLINPEIVNSDRSIDEVLTCIINHLQTQQRMPLTTFVKANGDTASLLPVPEECIITALYEVKKKKPHLKKLVPIFRNKLLQYILESPDAKLDNLLTFCRVYAASMKFDPALSLSRQTEYAWELCLKLLIKRMKYFPFAAISVLSIWSETWSSMSLTDFDPVQRILLKFMLAKQLYTSEEIPYQRWEICFKSIQMIFEIPFKKLKVTHILLEIIEKVKSCELKRLNYYIECLEVMMQCNIPLPNTIQIVDAIDEMIKTPHLYSSSKLDALREFHKKTLHWVYAEEENSEYHSAYQMRKI